MYEKKKATGKTLRSLLRIAMCVVLTVSLMPLALAVVPVSGQYDSWIGDATPDEYDFKVVGMVDEPAFFTMTGFIELVEDYAQTLDYTWKNSSGTVDVDTLTGVFLEDFLDDVMTLDDAANAMIITASDDFSRTFNLDDEERGAFWADDEGNQMMLAWNGNASRTNREIVDYELPKVVVGQIDPDDFNSSFWVSQIVEIRITAFNDIGRYPWALEAIEALAEYEVTTGVGDNRFDPAGSLTRGMFITFLGRALEAEGAYGDEEFTDVDYDEYYGEYVAWAVEEGLVQGYGDGTFGPNDDLKVEHMLIIAGRAGLTDTPESIEADANRPATRAEAAVIIFALMQLLLD